jgi:calcineurin-like phosphoesterase family protein
MKKHYVSIQDYKQVKDCGLDIILSHYPIAHWNGQFHGSVHLYGHIHATQDRAFFEMYMDYCKTEGLKFNAINVGCMMPYMGWTPRTLEYLLSECGMSHLIKG